MEDLNLFIEWNTPLRNLQRYVRQKLKQKSYVDDGRHVILDGLEVFLDPHRNMMNTLPFIDLSSSLGFDDKGHKRYLEIHKHLTDRFGPPTDLEDFLPYDFHGVRTAIWKHRSFQVGLYVWERFAVHFELRIEYLPNQH